MSWVDFSAKERDHMKQAVALFTEQVDTVDELGVGTTPWQRFPLGRDPRSPQCLTCQLGQNVPLDPGKQPSHFEGSSKGVSIVEAQDMDGWTIGCRSQTQVGLMRCAEARRDV